MLSPIQTLSEVIANPARAAQLGTCEELSGRYYSIIPHNFGRQRPVTINNMALLKKVGDSSAYVMKFGSFILHLPGTRVGRRTWGHGEDISSVL